MKKKLRSNYALLAILIFAAGIVYKIPYLKAVFYDQMISSLNISNTQLGILSSVYAGIKMIFYIPCGMLADKCDLKKVLSLSLVAEGILTGIYAMLPGMGMLEIIQALMAIANIFFWTSFIKSIRVLGRNVSQGKIFGFSEGFRGIAGSIATFAALKISSVFADSAYPIKYVLIFYSVVYLLIGITVFIIYPENLISKEERKSQTLAMYIDVFKRPAIWIISLLIFTSYSMQVAFEYTTTYMTKVIGISLVVAGTVATLRDNICGMIGSPAAGFAADKLKSPTKVGMILISIEIIFSAVLFFSPASGGFAGVLIGIILVFSVIHYGVRGIYYSTMSETGVPVALTSTATAVVAVLGYTPDMFMSLWCGNILDKYGYNAGFHKIFGLMILFAVLAFLVSLMLRFYQIRLKKNNNKVK